ncbi:MAG TPA: CPBP family intramembrane glutamic endopeptidase [Candidatus Eisenbacteria bacterium]|nr:CPBP family intramembrane glutamic endopeptidase [Candidatus Eisenbacteria bacterium]
MPTTPDVIVALLFAIGFPIWDYAWDWPRMMRIIRSGRPDARVPVYRQIMGEEWLMAAIVAALWVRAGRPWSALGLTPATGWRLGVAIALLATLLLLMVAQMRAVARVAPERLARTRARNAHVASIVPRTRAEFAWFQPLAVTAGVCEELIWRGFLVWAFRPWLGLWGAALASAVSFGFAHSYQGRRGVINTGVIGALFGLLVITTRSILPGIVLHALVDVMGGMTSYAVFRGAVDGPTAGAVLEPQAAE